MFPTTGDHVTGGWSGTSRYQTPSPVFGSSSRIRPWSPTVGTPSIASFRTRLYVKERPLKFEGASL